VDLNRFDDLSEICALRLARRCDQGSLLGHQFVSRDTQSTGYLVDVDEADVSLTSFNTTDVSSVQITHKRKCFLRNSILLPDIADPVTKVLLDLICN